MTENEEEREECVRVSKAVLIDDLADIEVPDNQWVKNL